MYLSKWCCGGSCKYVKYKGMTCLNGYTQLMKRLWLVINIVESLPILESEYGKYEGRYG